MFLVEAVLTTDPFLANGEMCQAIGHSERIEMLLALAFGVFGKEI